MLGSAASISDANVVLNTAVAESLRQYADVLERAEDFETALHDLIRNTIQAHKRIIFNGNGYDASWLEEAEKRGLLNLKTTPDCVPYLLKEKNVRLFTTHKISPATRSTPRRSCTRAMRSCWRTTARSCASKRSRCWKW